MAMQDGEAVAMVGEATVAAKAGTVAVAKVAAVGLVVKVGAEVMLVAKGVRVAMVAMMAKGERLEQSLQHRPRHGRCRQRLQ